MSESQVKLDDRFLPVQRLALTITAKHSSAPGLTSASGLTSAAKLLLDEVSQVVQPSSQAGSHRPVSTARPRHVDTYV